MSQKTNATLEMVLQFIEENDIKSTKELKKANRSYYNWIYNNKLSWQLPFLNKRRGWTRRDHETVYQEEFRENRTKDWYDLEKILPYLERYAEEEGTTVEQQCEIYYLLPEWDAFKQKNPDYSK